MVNSKKYERNRLQTTKRLIKLMSFLRAIPREFNSAADLAERFNARMKTHWHERTIKRDLDLLEDIEVVSVVKRGNKMFYQWNGLGTVLRKFEA